MNQLTNYAKHLEYKFKDGILHIENLSEFIMENYLQETMVIDLPHKGKGGLVFTHNYDLFTDSIECVSVSTEYGDYKDIRDQIVKDIENPNSWSQVGLIIDRAKIGDRFDVYMYRFVNKEELNL